MNLDKVYSQVTFRIGDKYRSVQIGFEVTQMKINITGIAMLIAAVVMLSSVTAFAQPGGQGMNRMNPGQFPGMNAQMKGVDRVTPGMPVMQPFIEPIFMGHGFALDGDEYHILHVNAVKTRVVAPGYARSLLGENMTPEEIAQNLNAGKRITEIRGHLVFADKQYALNITGYDNQSLSGDVLALPDTGGTEFAPETPEVVGYISISTSEYEGEMLSTGTLTMDGKEYDVLLNSPRAPIRIGRPGIP